jgi:predicted CxxxxCH...CXXCH cytochrome family protein
MRYKISFFSLLILMSLVFIGSRAGAFQSFDVVHDADPYFACDYCHGYETPYNCATCHTIFAGGPTSEGHVAHLAIGFQMICGECHVVVGDDPPMAKCATCHVKAGLIEHHNYAAEATTMSYRDTGICWMCHVDETPDPEGTMPPGYIGICLNLDPCDGSEELISTGSYTVSLDNDGDLLVDSDDPDCAVCSNPIARIPGTPPVQYTTLQEAYDLTVHGSTIQLNDKPFPEDIIYIDIDKTVYIEGGFNCAFASSIVDSVVYGSMLVSNGTLSIQSGILRLEAPPEECTDGIDNNDNGLIDCDDPDCDYDFACAGLQPEVCGDCVDNDGDGLVDCTDPDCGDDSACTFDSCTACHGEPPTDVNTLVGLPPGTGSVTAGAHATHSVTMVYDCENCHSGSAGSGPTHMNGFSITMGFSLFGGVYLGGSYDGQTTAEYDSSEAQTSVSNSGSLLCNTIYCHSDVQTLNGTAGPSLYASPQWDASVECDACHGQDPDETDGQPDSGSHNKHAGSLPGETNYDCAVCHSNGGDGSINHADGTINLDIGNSYGSSAAYSQGDHAPGSGGYGTCSNILCHSSVQADGGTGDPGAYATPDWGGGTVACDSCHGQAAETDGQPATGSHAKHAGSQAGEWSYDCSACHKNSGYGTDYHADSTINIDIDNIYDDGGTAAYSQGDQTPGINGYGTCSNVSCHGSSEATWGDPDSVSCESCHSSVTADTDDYIYDNDIIAQISATEWASAGHGRSSTYGGSGNPGANLTSCYYCHDRSASHGDTGNPFRLVNNSGPDGQNGVCLQCHGTGAGGYDPDGGDPLPLENSTVAVDSYHYGSLHGSGNNGGRFCWDCHDPHGDTNLFMIHDDVTKQSEGTYGIPSVSVPVIFAAISSGADYAKSSSPYDGICNVCHTSTDHYTSSSGDGHNASVRCIYCHHHNGADESLAFEPAEDCTGCHGEPPLTSATGGPDGLVGAPGTTGAASPGVHALHATDQEWTVDRTYIRYLWPYPSFEIVTEPTLKKGYNFPCETCHEGGMSLSDLSLDNDIQIGGSVITYGGDRLLNPPYSFVGTQYSYKGAAPADQNDPARPVVTGSVVLSGTDMKCATYCHSNGYAIYNGAVDTGFKSPAWDSLDSTSASLPCDTCHGYPPANGDVDNSSHGKHVQRWRYTCDKCHYETTDDGVTITNPALHGDGNVDVTYHPGRSEFKYFFSPGGGGSCSYLPGGEQSPYVGCHLIDNPDSGLYGVHGPKTWERLD